MGCSTLPLYTGGEGCDLPSSLVHVTYIFSLHLTGSPFDKLVLFCESKDDIVKWSASSIPRVWSHI
eukprot:415424-Amphidinium_carterae.1